MPALFTCQSISLLHKVHINDSTLDPLTSVDPYTMEGEEMEEEEEEGEDEDEKIVKIIMMVSFISLKYP